MSTIHRILLYAFILLMSSSLVAAPPQLKPGAGLPQVSAAPGDPVFLDVASFFEDPDGDSFTVYVPPHWLPLEPSLSYDPVSGELTGTVPTTGGPGFVTRIFAEDINGEESRFWFTVWVRISHGAFTSLFYRVCDPDPPYLDHPECVPHPNSPTFENYRSVQARGFVGESRPNEGASSSIYPEGGGESSRAAASVGYEGESLTPAISAYMRPANERFTGQFTGIARYEQTGEVTISGDLTYDHTGGILSPIAVPDMTPVLPFGSLAEASLFAFQLTSADGLIDPAKCDWQALNGGNTYTGDSIRDLMSCIESGMHPDITNFQQVFFTLPDGGFEDPVGQPNIELPPEPSGLASASLTIPYGGTPTELLLGMDMFMWARYGGEANSVNTLRASFDDPTVVEPAMDNVTEPTFEPAQESGGQVVVNKGRCILIDDEGLIPVTLFGSNDMAAADIDEDTIDFGGLDLKRCKIKDEDRDGHDDLECKFRDSIAAWTGSEGVNTISWYMQDGSGPFSANELICYR